ncbi:MinD/ParA family ATP-binding protein [Nocardia mangyaensis]|uniref:MinD/ParA family ATP-binding protein n=1 Tax=Nocardia mangyaensis TaxID=2213200 RepID=UPI002674BD43|nr:AAA family ATPase [Nocardia mangyaensis]MDO3650764.1 AAA family ATPase [Nocardia mangyaensis]
MTNNDHNPTSPPWLQSPSADTAEAASGPTGVQTATEADIESAATAEPIGERTDQPEQPGAELEPQAGTAEQTTVFQPGGFAPGPFAQNTYSVPDPYQSGGAHPLVNAPEQPWQGQPGPGEQPYPGPHATGEQPYPSAAPQYPGAEQPQFPGAEQPQYPGAEQPQFPGQEQPQYPGQEQQAQPPQSDAIYSWAPPPPPMYQPPMQGGMPPGHMPGQPGQPAPPPQWGQGGPGQQHQPFQPQHVTAPGQPGHSVNDLNLLKRARKAPRSGWRRAVHKASGGVINPGESAADVVHRDLGERVNQPVRGDYRIAILSLKGGVGKTTTTVGLGSTFASQRGDRVIAIDANPDLGTLAHRVPRQTRSTVRNLLEDQNITRYSDVRAHTSQAPSRLEVLASEQDPAVSEAFSEADYRKAIGILQSFYNIILTDCGTGLMHSAMSGVLDMASSLVLVTSPAIDGARSASATLDWLDHHGYSKLVERTVVVVNASRRGASTVDLDQLRKLFLDRTRAVQIVPFDDHLAEGAEIDLELVSKPTRRALLELAAMVADDFGYHGQPPQQSFQPGQQFQQGQPYQGQQPYQPGQQF